jgi:hypothetical protein
MDVKTYERQKGAEDLCNKCPWVKWLWPVGNNFCCHTWSSCLQTNDWTSLLSG